MNLFFQNYFYWLLLLSIGGNILGRNNFIIILIMGISVFISGCTFLSTDLKVINSDPKNGSTNVSSNEDINVTFNNKIKEGNRYIELKSSNGTIVPSNVTISGKSLIITPKALLKGTQYTLNLHSNSTADLEGNGLKNPTTIVFTTSE